MRVAVIGAGYSGLAAAKNCIQSGLDVIVYEQSVDIGGTWTYIEKTGKNEYGLDVHTSMYRDLITNLPKEAMGYPDFSYPDQEMSYLRHSDVLNFLKSYAVHFDLRKYIKFLHCVIRVRPIKNDKWEVIVQDLKTNIFEANVFDAIMVCNGNFHTPKTPHFSGIDNFRGKQMHSHDYRYGEQFQGERVLVIGSGPSGIDIVNDLSKYAERVILSHRMESAPKIIYANNVNIKLDIKEFTENGAIFKDGTKDSFSSILYCTGYNFTFPFLSSDCGIHVDDNFVQPLYKQCININYPTMSLIGLAYYGCPGYLFDLQTQFVIKHLQGEVLLPSKDEMQNDTYREMKKRWSMGIAKKYSHRLNTFQAEYYDDLAKIADVKSVPSVMSQICEYSYANLCGNIYEFRKQKYRIMDENTFITY